MDEKNVLAFKMECAAYLYSVSIHTLRSYGRSLFLRNPSVMKKGELITTILRVLVGEITQTRSNKGAPIKNDFIEPNFVQKIDALKEKYGLFPKKTGEENAQAAEPLSQEETTALYEDENEENVPVFATFEVNFSALNAKQKKLLTSFLNSL